MSWLVDIAGKAETFLNKIDQNAAVALNTSSKGEKDSRPRKTEPFLEPNPESENRTFNVNSSTTGVDHTSTSHLTTTVSRQNETKSNSVSKDSRSKNSSARKPPSGSKSITVNSKPTSSTESESTNASNSLKPKLKEDPPSTSKPITQNGIDKPNMVASEGSRETNTNEDDLIAYLNSSEHTGLDESLILKDEVESQARELKLLAKNHRSLQKDYEELKLTLESYRDKLATVETARHCTEAEEKDLRKLIEEKESEIHNLTDRHQQALDAIQKLELSQENAQKLEQCVLENAQLKSENESLLKRTEMLSSQVETAENHVLSMKATLSSMEKEFTNYKEKAKSILNYKDQLISSLKNEDPSTPRYDTSSSSNTAEELMAEVTALKNERELLQADLSQTRAIVGSLKDETIRLEKEVNTLRCFTEDLSGQLKREKETVGSLQSENLQLCQQLSSLQFELEREKNERKKNEELVTKLKNSSRSIDSKDRSQNGYLGSHAGGSADKELVKLKTRVSALSQSLYERQSLINDISTDKQLLQIEVEKLKNELRESRIENSDFCHSTGGLPQTVIASQPLYLSESPWDSRVSARMKRMYTQLDAVFCQFGLALRKRPTLRLGMSLYVIFLHLWVFFVLFSWTHHAVPAE